MVRFFRSLRFRLILLVVAALLPTVGVIIYNGIEDRREATAAAQDQLRRIVDLVAREQAQKTMAARHLLMGLAQVPAVRRQDAEACSALFARMISKPSLFQNIGAIYRNGDMFASGVAMPGPLNVSHLLWFQRAMETRDFAVGKLQIGRVVKKVALLFGYPVLDSAGEVQTVLYASVGLDWLQEVAAQARLPFGSILAIIDDQGAIMAKYPEPEKWVGKSLPAGGLFDIMQQHGEGIAEAQGMDGLPRVYAFTPLGREPRLGFVYAGIPTREVYTVADQALRRNLAVLGGVLLLALGFAWGFGYLFIMRRVKPLVQATARLAAGDLSVRTGLTGGPDELSQLAQAFDRMAASLQQRQAEREQSDREIQRLASFPLFNPNPVIEVNLAGEITYGNPASRAALQQAGGQDLKEFLPADLGEILAALVPDEEKKIYREVKIGDLTYGEYIHFVSQFQAVRIFGQDITVRQQAEAALQESDAMLREAQRIAHIGSWSMKLNDTIIRWSDELYHLYGVTKGEFLPTVASLLQLLHPDDRPLLERWIEQVISNLKPKEFDFRIILPDGAVRYIQGEGVLLTDQAGQPERIAGTAQDITERRQAEAALRESEELYRSLFDNMLNGFAYFQMLFEDNQPQDLIFLSVNRSFEPLTGLKDVVGKKVSEVIPGMREADPELFEFFGRVALTGQPERVEIYVTSLEKWFAIAAYSPAKEYFVTVFDVITERKQAEAELATAKARLEKTFAVMGDMVLVVDPATRTITACNQAVQDIFGYRPEEVVGRNTEFLHVDRAAYEEFGRLLFPALDRDGRAAFEFQMKRQDGSLIPCEHSVTEIRDEAGRRTHIVGVIRDISERKQAETALQQRFLDLAALYAASKAFLGQLGVAETLTAACRLAVEQFGLRLAWVGFADPGKDYLVRPVAVYGYEEGYLKAIQVTWDDSPTGCGPGGVTIRTRQAMVINDTETDPAFVPWREAALARGYRSVAGLPMFYEQEVVGTLLLYSGEPGYFAPDRIQVFQSLANQAAVAFQKARLYEETQRYAAELEDRVAERTAQLESTNQELDRFAYSVSHDLRAPLRAMQGFSLALLEDYAGELDPGGQDFARRINAAAERMDHLIQDLLAYSRISREEMALQPVSLEQTVAEAMAHVEGDIRTRQAQVLVEPPLPEVQAHRATLLQIVANLVHNAIKFTAPEVKPQVRLWAEDRGERVRLWVEDNGLGIAPEHQERIFRIFERLHGVEAYPGTGIGLAIVKKGVERMGGQVGVESELGQGSRFWVELEKAG